MRDDTVPNKTGAANSHRAGQSHPFGWSFITVAFRGQLPAAVADLCRSAHEDRNS